MRPKSDKLAFSMSLVSEEDMDEMLATEKEFRRACRRRDRKRGGGHYDPSSTDDLTAFMRSHGTIPPLTHDEVVDLSRRYHAGVISQSLLDSGEELDVEAVRRCEKLSEMGDLAREHLIISNIPLVFTLAPRRSRGGMCYTDFMQAGITGLIRAVEFFDHTKGFRFSTYAAYCVKRAFDDARSREGRLICLPRPSYDEMVLVLNAELEMEGRTGSSPTDAELAEKTGLREKRVSVLRRAAQIVPSLDDPAGDGVVDTLADATARTDLLKDLEDEFLSASLSSLVGELSDAEQFVVKHYYGLCGSENMSLEEIRLSLGITSQAARGRLRKALGKMRCSPRALGLDAFLCDPS